MVLSGCSASNGSALCAVPASAPPVVLILNVICACSGLLGAMATAMRDLAEQLCTAPASRATFQAVCALLQNPLWEDPEHSWCASGFHAALFPCSVNWRATQVLCIQGQSLDVVAHGEPEESNLPFMNNGACKPDEVVTSAGAQDSNEHV